MNVFENMSWQSAFLVKFVLVMWVLGFVAISLTVAYGISTMGWQRFRRDMLGCFKIFLSGHF
jgi:hypothetical protein